MSNEAIRNSDLDLVDWLFRAIIAMTVIGILGMASASIFVGFQLQRDLTSTSPSLSTQSPTPSQVVLPTQPPWGIPWVGWMGRVLWIISISAISLGAIYFGGIAFFMFR